MAFPAIFARYNTEGRLPVVAFATELCIHHLSHGQRLAAPAGPFLHLKDLGMAINTLVHLVVLMAESYPPQGASLFKDFYIFLGIS